MRSATLRYHVEAGRDLAAAVRCFSDFSGYAELHPLIAEVHEEHPAPAGVLRRYRILDRIPLGPIRWPLTYYADVLSVSDTEIVTVVRQRPRLTLHNVTRLAQTDGEVRADVEITMTAPALIHGYALSQARKAHAELAARLAQHLAG